MKIKNCPFCGTKGYYRYDISNYLTWNNQFQEQLKIKIYCGNEEECNAKIEEIIYGIRFLNKVDIIIKAEKRLHKSWNNRVKL